MDIAGLQKTTLIDYPGKIACSVFLHGCNFRCGFCYNAELVVSSPEGVYSREYVIDFLRSRVGRLDAVCITGGEPLISLEESFLLQIKEMGYKVKIDTNGSFPEKLKEFIDKGLVDYVAMDIKGTKEDYPKIAGVNVNMDDIERSIKIIAGMQEYEFRTTVLESFHTVLNVEKMAEWVSSVCGCKPRAYFLQGFKKEGDFIDCDYSNVGNTTSKHLEKVKRKVLPYFSFVDIRA